MASISTFLRKSPVSALRAYFETAAFDLPVTIDWEGEEADVMQPLLKAVNEMDEAEKSQFLLDAERVSTLADEAGNTALLSVVKGQAIFASLEVGHGCALWVFLNEPESFRKAEEVRYTDHRRHGRAWDGFVLAETPRFQPTRSRLLHLRPPFVSGAKPGMSRLMFSSASVIAMMARRKN